MVQPSGTKNNAKSKGTNHSLRLNINWLSTTVSTCLRNVCLNVKISQISLNI